MWQPRRYLLKRARGHPALAHASTCAVLARTGTRSPPTTGLYTGVQLLCCNGYVPKSPLWAFHVVEMVSFQDIANAAAPDQYATVAPNDFPTEKQLDQIKADLGGTWTDADFADLLANYAVVLGDLFASAQTRHPDDPDISPPGHQVHFNTLQLIVNKHLPCRRIANLFSVKTYNYYLANRPPMNWAKKGFSYEHRYVGFDGSYAIDKSAALLKVSPTTPLSAEDRMAIDANAQVLIYRAQQHTHQTSTLHEYNPGHPGHVPQITFQ